MTTISLDTQRNRATKFAKQFEIASYEMDVGCAVGGG